MGTLRKVRRVINGFDCTKVHTIYDGTIAWNINDNYSHPHQVEIPDSLYFTKGRDQLISTQHWAHNATYANADATNPYGTHCVTRHDHHNLIQGGG